MYRLLILELSPACMPACMLIVLAVHFVKLVRVIITMNSTSFLSISRFPK